MADRKQIPIPSSERRARFQDRLMIDRDDLDNEAAQQPKLFNEVGEEMVMARSRRDEVMDELKRLFSELSLEVRKELEDSGEKVTEARVDSEVRQRKAHVELKEKWLNRCREFDLWEVLYESYKQRSTMLKQLAELWVGGYYQSPGIKARQERYQETNRQALKKVR